MQNQSSLNLMSSFEFISILMSIVIVVVLERLTGLQRAMSV